MRNYRLNWKKNDLYARAKNVETGIHICRFLIPSQLYISIRKKEGDWFKCSTHFIKKSDFKWSICTALLYEKDDIAIELIENKISLNDKLQGYTPLMLASKLHKMNIVNKLIIAGADWNEKYTNYDNTDYYFLDYLDEQEKIEIITKFPEEYNTFIAKKESEKYNL